LIAKVFLGGLQNNSSLGWIRGASGLENYAHVKKSELSPSARPSSVMSRLTNLGFKWCGGGKDSAFIDPNNGLQGAEGGGLTAVRDEPNPE